MEIINIKIQTLLNNKDACEINIRIHVVFFSHQKMWKIEYQEMRGFIFLKFEGFVFHEINSLIY